MPVKWGDAFDLAQQEIRNAVIQNLGSDPGSPVNGQIWYLTTGGHDFRIRLNGSTVSLLPTSLLATANTWTSTNAFNGAVTGNSTINFTGAGASSVGGTLSATAHIAAGLTGATAASRYVGATASGAPASGTFAVGDYVIDQTGTVIVCTGAGTPGTWKRAGDYLLAASNSWSGANTFTGGVVVNTVGITGNKEINLTGTGTSGVGGTFTGTALIASGLTGATAASRYGGATASGAPASGTWATGDFVVAQNGHMWICTAGGTPGTWVDVATAGALTLGSTVVTETAYGQSSTAGVGTTASKVDHTHGSPTHIGTDHSAISISSLSAPTGDVAWGSHKITGLLDPTGPQDAATKNYVDNAVAGLAWKDAVAVATTGTLPANTYANGASGVGATLTATANGALAAQDGYTPVVNDRILVKNEAAPANNGIYVVTQVGTGGTPYILTRATDADTPAELQGATAYVMNGTANGALAWTMTQSAAITVGTTALNWAIQSGANSVTAGAGLTSSTNQFNVGAGTGITVAADSVSVDTSLVARWKTGLIGNGVATSIAVTHSLGNQFVLAMAYDASTNAWEPTTTVLTDANTVTFTFGVAPATNGIRYVIVG